MLCRYLNGRGYIRYGCNTQYNPPYKPNDKINPCPILCKDSKIYSSKVKYWVDKLFLERKLFKKLIFFYDSKNPKSNNSPLIRDRFCLICLNEKIYDDFISKHTLDKYLNEDQ